MTTAIILIVILLTLALFYLKFSLMVSLATLFAALFATVAALSGYEAAASFLLSRGYGGDWALTGCYLAVFLLTFVVFRAAMDYLIGTNIDLGNPAKITAALVCGLVTGMLLAGNILVAMGMMPLQNKFVYTRFPAEQPIVLTNPSKPILNVDGFVTGLYGWLSRGALASGVSFAVTEADFLTKCHLNRYRVNEGAQTTVSPRCLVLPPKGKKPLRIWTIPDKGTYMVLRVGIVTRSIADGGAQGSVSPMKFSMGQLRLICKPSEKADTLRGTGTAVWPEGLLKQGQFIAKKLEDIPDDKAMLGFKDGALWVDAAFKVPAGQTPVAFQFKQNATISLIGVTAVPTSPEVEQELSADEKKAENQPGI